MTKISNLGFQLYSARFEDSLDAKLKVLADLGYGLVEPYRAMYEDVEGFREKLGRYGLQAKTGHFGFGEIRENPDHMIDVAKTLGIDVMVISAVPVPERENTLAEWKALAAEVAKYGKMFSDSGLRFAWHNHAYEFAVLEDGSTPMQLLLDANPDMLWQVDIGWVYRGRQDPSTWFSKYGDRVFSIHLKDIAADGECLDEDGWADVGHGVLDWSMLWPMITKLNPEVFTVEHDKPSDYRRSAERSLAAFRRLTEES